MRKFIFYTPWGCNKLEKYLEHLESIGFRLVRFSFVYWFDFIEVAPKHVQYFYTTSFIKDCEMLEDEFQLRQQCGANPILSIASGLNNLHRITNTDIDIDEFRRSRNRILRKIIIKKTIMYIMALIGAICGYCLFDKMHRLLFPLIVLLVCLTLGYDRNMLSI